MNVMIDCSRSTSERTYLVDMSGNPIEAKRNAGHSIVAFYHPDGPDMAARWVKENTTLSNMLMSDDKDCS